MTQKNNSAIFTQSLKGTTVLVLGACTHLEDWNNGKAAAMAYARAGAQVVCVDKDLVTIKPDADHILEDDREALASKTKACDTKTVEHFGTLNVLHNNVGITSASGPLYIGDDLFRKAMDINMGSILRTTCAVLPQFLK